jgi:hypothetical protein
MSEPVRAAEASNAISDDDTSNGFEEETYIPLKRESKYQSLSL